MQVRFSASPKVHFGNQNEWKEAGFPSKPEHEAFKRWVAKNKLNTFGDPDGTVYAGGSPIWTSGQKLYDYVTQNHPDKPWNQP